ncbi:MAG TPA: aspartate--tRNA ligase [Planctomycetota bacterium]|nr:aspartate--tRNA ligase [Planctomycetota bacterium]
MTDFATTYRTLTCGELGASHIGKTVTLAGFVDRRNENMVQLRDRYGTAKLLLTREAPAALRNQWERLQPEYVISATGKVVARPKMGPGDRGDQVDVNVEKVEVLSASEPLPPELAADTVELDDRLRYRNLDLRRPAMQERLAFRSRFLQEIRSSLHGQGFTEIDTPLLTKWTPEATQSFVVPAGAGRAFALPGTPQSYKQLLMAGGVDRYFQLARCFRHENELTAEKQLEFTTLDVEIAFADEEDIFKAIDGLVSHVWGRMLGATIATPIPRITYEQAMRKYGTDCPDLRFSLEIQDISLFATQAASPAFREGAGARAIRAEAAAEIVGDNELNQIAQKLTRPNGATVSWVKVGANRQLRGPGARLFQGNDHHDLMNTHVPCQPGDVLLVILTKTYEAVNKPAGLARKHLGKALSASVAADKPAFAIITRFPFYEYAADDEAWNPCRHPFTQPIAEDIPLMETNKYQVRTMGYDLVLNGIEIGAGSIRNHDVALQRKVFEMFEYKPQEVETRFGAILDAFRFGCPPHGGFAIGMDRLLALVQGQEDIAEVIAFPKNRNGEDLMFAAPAPIDQDVLAALLGAAAVV